MGFRTIHTLTKYSLHRHTAFKIFQSSHFFFRYSASNRKIWILLNGCYNYNNDTQLKNVGIFLQFPMKKWCVLRISCIIYWVTSWEANKNWFWAHRLAVSLKVQRSGLKYLVEYASTKLLFMAFPISKAPIMSVYIFIVKCMELFTFGWTTLSFVDHHARTHRAVILDEIHLSSTKL